MNVMLRGLISAAFVVCAMTRIAHAETAFTYQGRLSTAGAPAQGSYDFQFRLFNAETGGAAVGSLQSSSGVAVSGGVFSVLLDFGDGPFNSASRWLEIAVREAGGGSYTVLTPRQRIGASPFAIETMFVAPGAVDTAALQDNAITTQKIADGNVFTDDLANFAVATGKLSNQAVTQLKVANDAIGTAQIEDNTVTSADIRDGTISPADVDGGLYSRKGQVLYYTATASIGFGIQRVTVSCAGANDIPVVHVCNVPSDDSDLTVLSERLTSIDNDVNPARLRCTAENRDPNNSETLTAIIGCIPVP